MGRTEINAQGQNDLCYVSESLLGKLTGGTENPLIYRGSVKRVLNRRWVNFVRNQLEENTVYHLYAQSDPIAPPPESYSIDRQPIIIIENTDHNGILRDYRTHQHIQNLLAT